MTASAWNPNSAVVPQLNANALLRDETQFVTAATQKIFNLKTFAYVPGTGSLFVIVNGSLLARNVDYLEVDGSTVLLTNAAVDGDKITFIGFIGITGSTTTDPILRSDLASGSGCINVGFTAVAGVVKRTLDDKLKDTLLSVKDFGAVCDGVTDDYNAIVAAITYLKAHGGGGLYFPKYAYSSQTIYLDGNITGVNGYTTPALPRITLVGNGASGIISGVNAGDVIRMSSGAAPLNWKVGFRDFVIDGNGHNVTALNGNSQTGIGGPNHYVDINGLKIIGICGAAAVGIDFGSITDSTIHNVMVQGSGAGANIGYRLAKANVKLVNCYAVYCTYGTSVQALAEASVNMSMGGFITCGTCIYWEPTGAFSYSSASILTGVFLGESNNGGKIFGAASPTNLDVGSFSMLGCVFDSYRPGQDLMTVNFGGRFTLIGNVTYYGSTGLTTVDLGQYAVTTWLGNSGMSVKPGCAALVLNKVNNFGSKSFLDFYANGVVASSANFLLNKDGGSIKSYRMPFAGTIIGIGLQSSSALTASTIDFQVEINSTGIAASNASLPVDGYKVFAAGNITFNAGDLIQIRCYPNAFTPTPVDVSAQLIIQC